MKRVKWLSLLTCLCLTVGLLAGVSLPASEAQAAKTTIADMDNFTFKGSMSQEVLRSYCAHAVTLAGFCVENLAVDPYFEDDLRMIQNVGAKFIGRAAYYSWGGYLSWNQIQEHYRLAEERAAAAHKADPELILQAGVFEIAYKATVNNTPIPAYVFEAFGLPVEERNFRFDDIIWETGELAYANKFWGNDGSCVPNITRLETQMYFYWQITRYIDAGFESVHLGQATLMANHQLNEGLAGWDKVTTLARAYAKKNARRGIVLFDCHVGLGEAMKIGDRLITDIFACSIAPNETVKEDDAMQCEVLHYRSNGSAWLGRAPGGQHPLGFTCEQQPTIMEFDNHGLGEIGVATPFGHLSWGYDDITWFAVQPEWYRNKFLAETQEYLANDPDTVNSKGEQVSFIQFSLRRVTVVDYTRVYYDNGDLSEAMESADKDKNVSYEFDSFRKRLTLTVAFGGDYRANNQSAACPNGSNQEAVIKAIMAGEKVDEALFDRDIEQISAGNPRYTAASKTTTTTTTKKPSGSASSTTKSQANGGATTAKPLGGDVTTAHGDGNTAVTLPADGSEDTVTSDATPEVSETPEDGATSESADPSEDTADTSDTDTKTDTDPKDDKAGMPVWTWILIAVVAVVAVGVIVLLIVKKGKVQ